jgi:hypothetical protein
LRNHILHIIKMSCRSSWKMTSTNCTEIVCTLLTDKTVPFSWPDVTMFDRTN